ncbi:MAG: RNA recognition motif-containing protein [Lichina confinis]|nr:MAG: RNA recognition motif-containing protein [Lichina confinis]
MAGPNKKRRLSDGTAAVLEAATSHKMEAASVGKTDIQVAPATPAQSKKKQKSSRQLFISGLPLTVTEDDLTAYFSETYPLRHVVLVRDSTTKASRGYGFVTFADVEDATRAREEFKGKELGGQKIRLDFAEHRHRAIGDGAHPEKDATKKSDAVAGAQRGREARKPPKLIVRNLPWSIKDPDQLAALFRSYGKVKHSIIPKGKKSGLMSGFGFVTMRGYRNAEKAIEGVNGKVVDDRPIAVDWAVEKDVWEELQEKQREADAKDEDHQLQDSSQATDDDADGGARFPEEDGLSVGSEAELEADMHSDVSNEGEARNREAEADEDGEASTTPDNSSTVFVRNVPYTASDDSLYDLFKGFGPVRYARLLLDPATERPRGTAFVSFYRQEDCETCLREAPRKKEAGLLGSGEKGSTSAAKYSVLEDELADPTGRYTVDGRVVQVSRAVSKEEAAQLREKGSALRSNRDRDKRRLYLLSEGTVTPDSALYDLLSPAEIRMREASTKQRKSIVQNNPSLHLSLIRLSIRNIPRSIDSKGLKELARQAVVHFAKDVKANKRQPLSKEELRRDSHEMKLAERERKTKGKGIVKQAKVVFEGQEGGKVAEKSGAGRSRGYGFIEYSSHRWALMGLRWLNGHAVSYSAKDEEGHSEAGRERVSKKKRLIAEFAMENAQVVARRKEKESKARERSTAVQAGQTTGISSTDNGAQKTRAIQPSAPIEGKKRKRTTDSEIADASGATKVGTGGAPGRKTAPDTGKEQLAKRQRIITMKRKQRKARKGSTAMRSN